MPKARKSGSLLSFHERLSEHYGPLGWWPGETPFEVMVGAVLTQNTAWTNVEKAIANLKAERALSLEAIDQMPHGKLARLLRPSGYFRVKATRLKNLVRAVREKFGSLPRMFKTPTDELRAWLLSVNGVGKETADSILCYAAEHPVFVVDAYTRRVYSRHGFLPPEADYDELQEFSLERLPRDLATYNEFHAQIVNVGKDFCRTRPKCEGCPLEPFLTPAQRRRLSTAQ